MQVQNAENIRILPYMFISSKLIPVLRQDKERLHSKHSFKIQIGDGI